MSPQTEPTWACLHGARPRARIHSDTTRNTREEKAATAGASPLNSMLKFQVLGKFLHLYPEPKLLLFQDDFLSLGAPTSVLLTEKKSSLSTAHGIDLYPLQRGRPLHVPETSSLAVSTPSAASETTGSRQAAVGLTGSSTPACVPGLFRMSGKAG